MSENRTQADVSADRVIDPDRRGSRLRVLMLSCVAGLAWAMLTYLSLPPVSLWWVGLGAPLPVALVACTTRRALLSALGVSVGTLPLWLYHHAWVADVSLAGVVPFVLYLAVWPGLIALVISGLVRSFGRLGPAAAVPTAWVAIEFVRGEIVFGGYAWFLAGQPMVESVTVSRAATLGGVYFVSWLVVAVSGVAIASRYRSGGHRRTAVGVSAALIALLLASIAVQRDDASREPVRVAALQTNVPQSNKVFPSQDQLVADFRALVELAEEAADRGADLVVTPETVLPGGLLDPAARAVIDEPFGAAMLAEQARIGVPMLVGCTTLGGVRDDGDRFAWDDTFNSVFLLVDGRVSGPRYDKLRPTPFGETLPYVQSLPWLRDLILRIGLGASGMDFGLTPGSNAVSQSLPIRNRERVLVTPICFESSMPGTVRRLVNDARASGQPAELLCVMTNDGWFGSFDTGRSMHMLQARWRSIEHALPTIRSANTGVSAVIDRHGRVLDSLPPRTAGVLVADIDAGPARTVYQSVGDAFGAVCVVLTTVGLVLSFRSRRLANSESLAVV